MKIKKIIILFLFLVGVFLLVGCERKNIEQGYIQISWQNDSNANTTASKTISQSENVSTNNLPIKEHYYSTQSTDLGDYRTKVFAFYYNANNELVPDAQFDFVFNAPVHSIEEINNSDITLVFTGAGKGNLIAKHKDLTATVNFTVFPTELIGWSKSVANVKRTFNFKEGAANEHNHDIYYDDLNNSIYSVYGFAVIAIQDMTQILDEFDAFDSFENLTYSVGYLWEGLYDPWEYHDKIMIIKTQTGYAKTIIYGGRRIYKDSDIWIIMHDYVEKV